MRRQRPAVKPLMGRWQDMAMLIMAGALVTLVAAAALIFIIATREDDTAQAVVDPVTGQVRMPDCAYARTLQATTTHFFDAYRSAIFTASQPDPLLAVAALEAFDAQIQAIVNDMQPLLLSPSFQYLNNDYVGVFQNRRAQVTRLKGAIIDGDQELFNELRQEIPADFIYEAGRVESEHPAASRRMAACPPASPGVSATPRPP